MNSQSGVNLISTLAGSSCHIAPLKASTPNPAPPITAPKRKSMNAWSEWLRLSATNVDGGTGGIGDDADLLMTPVVHSRTTLRENDYSREGLKVHVTGSFNDKSRPSFIFA